jgi:hypothetical protein
MREVAMLRTIISLEADEKDWLESMAKKKHISMAAVIRTAIKNYRLQHTSDVPSNFGRLLLKTKGIWQNQDGLDYQLSIRNEWEEEQ